MFLGHLQIQRMFISGDPTVCSMVTQAKQSNTPYDVLYLHIAACAGPRISIKGLVCVVGGGGTSCDREGPEAQPNNVPQ
jgi:hypothetical protein